MADVKRLCVGYGWALTGTPSVNNHVLDANNDGWGAVFQARDATAITHIGFRYGARTGTPPTYVATLEGVSATTGDPDGADVGGGSPTAKTFTPPADTSWDGTWQWIALTNSFTPTSGALYAATIRYSSGTVDGSNNSSLTTDYTNYQTNNVAFPYTDRLTAGTWAKRTGGIFGIRTASTRYGCPLTGFYNTRSASTVGHRQAMKFNLPAGSGDTLTIGGVRILGSITAGTGKTPILGLWSASGSVQTLTLDSEQVRATGSYSLYEFRFASPTAINFGTDYYIGFEVADAASAGVIVNGAQLDNASDLDAWPGGSNFYFSSYNDTTWSDDQTVRPFVELIVDDITEPAASAVSVQVSNVMVMAREASLVY